MPEYTQEQIAEAIETLKKCTEIEGRYKTGPYKCKQPTMGGYVYISEGIFTISLLKERDTILAALEAAQKERDELKESLNGMSDAIDVTKIWTDRCVQHSRAEALAAYAAKLEKAGDGMRVRLAFNYKPCVDWDTARKEKP